MTPCLGPDEFVDLLEGQLPAVRVAHLDACPACRGQFARLQGTLRDTLDAPVPEPSPLFWAHLAERVRRVVDADGTPPRERRWWRLPALAPAVGLSAAVMMLVASVAGRPAAAVATGARAGDLPATLPVAATDTLADVEVPDATAAGDPLAGDAPIDALAALVAGLDWDELSAAGLAVAPGAADAVVDTLALQERVALVRALRAALEGPES